jgi:hypothetical protein
VPQRRWYRFGTPRHLQVPPMPWSPPRLRLKALSYDSHRALDKASSTAVSLFCHTDTGALPPLLSGPSDAFTSPESPPISLYFVLLSFLYTALLPLLLLASLGGETALLFRTRSPSSHLPPFLPLYFLAPAPLQRHLSFPSHELLHNVSLSITYTSGALPRKSFSERVPNYEAATRKLRGSQNSCHVSYPPYYSGQTLMGAYVHFLVLTTRQVTGRA